MLPEGERIHTLRNPGGILLGLYWDRDRVIEAIRENKCELASEAGVAMKHGLCVWFDGDPLFVETAERGNR